MSIGIQFLWLIVAAVMSFLVGLLLDIMLPEKYRIKFQLKKKKFSKWVKNPSYMIGITSRLDLKRSMDLDNTKAKLKQLFSSKDPTFRGTEIYFKSLRSQYEIDVMIQLAYEEEEREVSLQTYSLNLTVNSKAKYRHLRNQIDDLRASLDQTEKVLIKNLELFPARQTLFVEIEYLEKFSEILENLKAKQITGIVKDTDAKFHSEE